MPSEAIETLFAKGLQIGWMTGGSTRFLVWLNRVVKAYRSVRRGFYAHLSDRISHADQHARHGPGCQIRNQHSASKRTNLITRDVEESRRCQAAACQRGTFGLSRRTEGAGSIAANEEV